MSPDSMSVAAAGQPSDELFEAAAIDSLRCGPTSPPTPDDDSTGIRIAAPATVVLGHEPRPRIVVSGTIRLAMGAFGAAHHATRARLVVVGPPGAAVMRAFSPSGVPAPRAGATNEPLAICDTLITTWFHTDVLAAFDDPQPGAYFIHAFLGSLVSHGVRVVAVSASHRAT